MKSKIFRTTTLFAATAITIGFSFCKSNFNSGTGASATVCFGHPVPLGGTCAGKGICANGQFGLPVQIVCDTDASGVVDTFKLVVYNAPKSQVRISPDPGDTTYTFDDTVADTLKYNDRQIIFNIGQRFRYNTLSNDTVVLTCIQPSDIKIK